MIWHSDDITTAMYGFWDEIYNYNGELIVKCGIDQDEGAIYDMKFVEENSKIEVTITYYAKEEKYTKIYPLTKAE